MKRILTVIISVPLTALLLLGIVLAFYEMIDFFNALRVERAVVFVHNTALWLSSMAIWIALLALFVITGIALRKVAGEKRDASTKKTFKIIVSAVFIGGLVVQVTIVSFANNIVRIIAIEHGYLYCAVHHGRNKESGILIFTNNAATCQAFRDSARNVKE